MEEIIKYSHIIAGGFSVILPIIVMLTKKGTKRHVLLGNIFFTSMLLVSISGLVLSVVTNNIFLLAIAVFTMYMLILGKLAFKVNKAWVRSLFLGLFFILFTSIMLLGYITVKLIMLGSMFSIVTLLFTAGVAFMLKMDVKFYRDGGNSKVFHLSKMLGATIAAYTAFLVVNFSQYSILLTWIGPSVIGTALIIFYVRRNATGKLKKA